MLDEEFRHPLCCNFFGAGYEEGRLGAVMVSNSKDGVVFLGLREFRDEVQGDNFKWVCLWFREYRCQRGLGRPGVDLVTLALCAPSNILYYVLPESRPPVPPLEQVRGTTDPWVTMHG